MGYYFASIDGSIVIMTKFEDKPQFRPPLGAPNPELDKQVLKLALNEGTDPPLSVIDAEAKERLSMLYPKLNYIPHRDFFDYVYLSQNLVELPGKKYLKIRNLLNRFKKNIEYKIEPITTDNIDEVTGFLMRWCLWKDCDKIPLLKSEKKAVLYCIDHYLDLDLSGLVIRIDDNIEAASIYETLNQDTAVIHFEKAIPDFAGLYQAINQEAAKVLVKAHRFINRESDMGFSGLRLAKQKYQPHHMVEVYHLSREELKKNLK